MDEPLLVLISFDGSRIIASQIDEAVKPRILPKKTGFHDTNIDCILILRENKILITYLKTPKII